MPSATESTPLLWDVTDIHQSGSTLNNGMVYPNANTPAGQLPPSKKPVTEVHAQFCSLVGCPPSNLPEGTKFRINPRSLYGRAIHDSRTQGATYVFTASLSNFLLLAQIVLGAALTGLGAAKQDPVLITVFGAMNTVIAGLVAYLKSRGQPMRSRMYKDDLEKVVDEIENSEVMWLGIATGIHGYDDIDTDDEVTVRSEVARLTRLYDRAVRNNTMNNPDLYMSGTGFAAENMGLRNRGSAVPTTTLPATMPPAASTTAPESGATAAPAPTANPAVSDPDQSPASAPPKPKEEAKKDDKSDNGRDTDSKSQPADAANKDDKDKGKKPETSPAPVAASAPAPTPASAPAPAQASGSASNAGPVPLRDDAPEPATEANIRRSPSPSDKNEGKPKKVEGDNE